jgi:hypothetical protein
LSAARQGVADVSVSTRGKKVAPFGLYEADLDECRLTKVVFESDCKTNPFRS